MTDQDIKTNKNLNFEIKLASASHLMRARIELRPSLGLVAQAASMRRSGRQIYRGSITPGCRAHANVAPEPSTVRLRCPDRHPEADRVSIGAPAVVKATVLCLS